VRLLAVLLLLTCAALGQERAFVEMTAPKDAYYVREWVPVTLRIGYDREFFRTNAVPLFPQRMDVPVQVRAEFPGDPVASLDFGGAPDAGPTFVLNDRTVHATRASDIERDGRAFTVLELEWPYSISDQGKTSVAAPTLRYAFATQFDEDFVIGRVARDPKDLTVTGKPLSLRILPLPEEGRPEEFEGAVGRFTITAEVSRASVDVGKSFNLTLSIRGFGYAMKKRIDLPGFHVYGTIYKEGGHVASLSLAPLSADVREIPAIPFAFFDPGPPAGYRVLHTEPIPLEVRGGATKPPPPQQAPPREGFPTMVVLGAALLAVALAGLLVWLRRRPSTEAAPDPAALRVRAALAALHTTAAVPGADLADPFAALLSAYLGCPIAAVIGPDLAERLVTRGLVPDLASRAAATLERLVAARYGSSGAGEGDFAALLSEIEGALSPPS